MSNPPTTSTKKDSQKKSRRLVSSGAQLDDLEPEDLRDQSNQLAMTSFRFGFILAAITLICWSDLLKHLRDPISLNHTALRIAYISGGIEVICISLVILWKYIIQRGTSYRHLRMRARRPLQVIVFSGLIAFLALVKAFWPVYGFKGMLFFSFLGYSFLCFLSFI